MHLVSHAIRNLNMKTLLFLVIVIFSGFSAGIIHGLVNLVVVEPFLDKAIGIENQNMFGTGETRETPDFWQKFDAYRMWQKEGEVLAGGILGLASGALFGLVFAYVRGSLPSNNDVKKALLLCSIMLLVIFFIPFLKYPANPPAVGDTNTISFRQSIYSEFIALSGLGALGFSVLYKKLGSSKKLIAPLGYTIFITIAFLLMPDNPDKITISMDLVNQFRIASLITVTISWIANALILGALWQRFQPHITRQQIQ